MLFGDLSLGTFGIYLEGQLVDIGGEGGLAGLEFFEGVYSGDVVELKVMAIFYQGVEVLILGEIFLTHRYFE